MKRTITILVGSTFAALVGVLLWHTPASHAQGQSGCKRFHAIVQATLPSSTPLYKPGVPDVWGGPLYGMLNDELLSNGALSGNDGEGSMHGVTGMGKGGSYTICVDPPVCNDTFTYEVPNAVWPIPPGRSGFLTYIGNTATIVQGTGKFASASGNLNVTGPAIVWPDSSSPFEVSGRWDGELSGKVCGIE